MGWMKTINDPYILLAVFALSLVFGFVRRNRRPTWLPTGAYLLACIALVGALALSYLRLRSNPLPSVMPQAVREPIPAPAHQVTVGNINQTSNGKGAVNTVEIQNQNPATANSDDVAPPIKK